MVPGKARGDWFESQLPESVGIHEPPLWAVRAGGVPCAVGVVTDCAIPKVEHARMSGRNLEFIGLGYVFVSLIRNGRRGFEHP
jgi:hypothetical protein